MQWENAGKTQEAAAQTNSRSFNNKGRPYKSFWGPEQFIGFYLIFLPVKENLHRTITDKNYSSKHNNNEQDARSPYPDSERIKRGKVFFSIVYVIDSFHFCHFRCQLLCCLRPGCFGFKSDLYRVMQGIFSEAFKYVGGIF